MMRRLVRKAALHMLSSAAHNKALMVASHLPSVMPRVYSQTEVDKSLIRVVDLGPFKHTIDDGLELRKAAFECMEVLLDNCLDRLDHTPFIKHLESGLKVGSDTSPYGSNETIATLSLSQQCSTWQAKPDMYGFAGSQRCEAAMPSAAGEAGGSGARAAAGSTGPTGGASGQDPHHPPQAGRCQAGGGCFLAVAVPLL